MHRSISKQSGEHVESVCAAVNMHSTVTNKTSTKTAVNDLC